MLSYIIWDANPFFVLGESYHIRYYGLMYVLAYVVGYLILRPMFRKDKATSHLLFPMIWIIVGGELIGARLGHCFFYDSAYYLKHPLEIIQYWKGGVASHGVVIGVLAGLIVFSRYVAKKPLSWSTDRVVIVLALASPLIRIGNLYNSEIYGKPTDCKHGFVYVRDTELGKSVYTGGLHEWVEDLTFQKLPEENEGNAKAKPLLITLKLNSKVSDKIEVQHLVNSSIIPLLSYKVDAGGRESNVFLPDGAGNEINIMQGPKGFEVLVKALAIPKHPTQVYEAFLYFSLFLLLLYLYVRKGAFAKPGLLTGVFLFYLFFSRFMIEFFKQNQVAAEQSMRVNIGQLLSIPCIVAGLILVYLSMTGKTRKLLKKY